MEWWLPHLNREELSEGEPPDGYRTVAAVITMALDHLRARFGSVEAMLGSAGMAPDLPVRLRSALLDR